MEFSSRARWYLEGVSEPGLWLSSSHSCHHETLWRPGLGVVAWPADPGVGSPPTLVPSWSTLLQAGPSALRSECSWSLGPLGDAPRPGRGLHVVWWGCRLGTETEMASYCLATARRPAAENQLVPGSGASPCPTRSWLPAGDISGPAVSPAGSLRLGQPGACRAPGHSNGYVIRARPGIFENPRKVASEIEAEKYQ